MFDNHPAFPVNPWILTAVLAATVADARSSAGVTVLDGATSGRVDGSATAVGTGSQGWTATGVQVRSGPPAWADAYAWWYDGVAQATLSEFSDGGVSLRTAFAENFQVSLSYRFSVTETTTASIRAWQVGFPFTPPSYGYWNVALKPEDDPIILSNNYDWMQRPDCFYTEGRSTWGAYGLQLIAGKTYELTVSVSHVDRYDSWSGFGRPDFGFELAIPTGVPAPGGIALIATSVVCRPRRRRQAGVLGDPRALA